MNLNQANVTGALEALVESQKHHRVKNAHVHAETVRTKSRQAKGNMEKLVVDTFRTLGQLPKLSSIKMDLGFAVDLPIEALAALFHGPCAARLTHLEFSNLQFVSDQEALPNLIAVLKAQTNLRTLKFSGCRGCIAAVEALLLYSPVLRRLEINSTAIDHAAGTNANPRDSTLVKLVQHSSNLKALSLINLPHGQISDSFVKAMADELSSSTTRLIDLTIVSSLLTQESGMAIR